MFLLLIVSVAYYISARKLTVSMIFNVKKTTELSFLIIFPYLNPVLRHVLLGLISTSHETEVVK